MAAAAAANGQTVFITGASRGIGLGLVETYAKKGFRVIAAARNPAKADKLQAVLKTYVRPRACPPAHTPQSHRAVSAPDLCTRAAMMCAVACRNPSKL